MENAKQHFQFDLWKILACDASCATCSVGNNANKCLTCPDGKVHSGTPGTDGTCGGWFILQYIVAL